MDITDKMDAVNLTPEHFSRFPVWEILCNDSSDALEVSPVTCYPVSSLVNSYACGCGIDANREQYIVMVTGIDTKIIENNDHIPAYWIWSNNQWIYIKRYHDPGYSERWTAQIAELTGKTISLPITVKFPSYGGVPIIRRSDGEEIFVCINNVDENKRLSINEIMLRIIKMVDINCS